MKNLQKHPLATAIAAGLLSLAAGPAHADLADDIEFSIGVFSDHLDDGESGSGNNATVIGAFEYGHASGLFTGVEMLNIESGAGSEVIPFLGYGFGVGAVDVEAAVEHVYVTGPVGGDSEEAGELILGAGYGAYADDDDAEGDMLYAVGAEHEVLTDISLGAGVGYDDPDADDEDGIGFWELGVIRSTDFGDLSLTYGSRDDSDAQDLFVAGWEMSF